MKCIEDSLTIQTHIIMPQHLNAVGNLFGGQLLSWVDMVAGIVAMRHADAKVVTACIDHLEFKKSASNSDVLTLIGKISWVGNTSMEVRVDSYRENKGVNRELVNTAYLVMVAIDDETGKPKPVEKLYLSTDEEKAEFEAGEKRRLNRKARKEDNF